MQRNEVRRSGAPVWRERVARQSGSGLSVGEFCRGEGLSVWSFYRWRLRLRAQSGTVKRVAKRREVIRREPVRAEVDGAFIDLGALQGASSPVEVRIDLGGGVILQLARR